MPTLEILTSTQAADRYRNARYAREERLDAKLGRLCRFFRASGMPLPFDCPPPPQEPEPGD